MYLVCDIERYTLLYLTAVTVASRGNNLGNNLSLPRLEEKPRVDISLWDDFGIQSQDRVHSNCGFVLIVHLAIGLEILSAFLTAQQK